MPPTAELMVMWRVSVVGGGVVVGTDVGPTVGAAVGVAVGLDAAGDFGGDVGVAVGVAVGVDPEPPVTANGVPVRAVAGIVAVTVCGVWNTVGSPIHLACVAFQ